VTTTKEGRLLFTMLAAIAQFETGLRKEPKWKGLLKPKKIMCGLVQNPGWFKKVDFSEHLTSENLPRCDIIRA